MFSTFTSHNCFYMQEFFIPLDQKVDRYRMFRGVFLGGVLWKELDLTEMFVIVMRYIGKNF